MKLEVKSECIFVNDRTISVSVLNAALAVLLSL